MTTEHAKISQWQNQLVPHIVDHLASVKPDALYAEYPVSPTSYEQGFRPVTYKDFANAINGLAWWMTQSIGSSRDFEVLAYIGPNDIRYTALVLAAVKAGFVMFFTSPRNSIVAQESLFTKLECTKLLSPDPKPPAVTAIQEHCNFQHFTVPSVEELLDNPHPAFEYSKRYPEASNEPLFVLHTSGSTGIPKPIVYRHESAVRNMNMLSRGPPEGFKSQDRLIQGKRMINTFPPFHGACLVAHLFISIPFGSVMIAPLAQAIPTAEGVVQTLKSTSADVAYLVPSIVLELSQDAKLLDFVANSLELVLYCGGDLPTSIGDIISSKMRINCQYGASEVGIAPQVLPEGMQPSDWKYVCLHPDMGMTYEESADGLSEMVFIRDSKKEETQPTFSLFPDLSEYRTRDLFEQHPKIPHLWTWRARADDIIVFLNGEKTNPVSFEQHVVAENPEIGAAIVVGAQRFQAALLLEPAPAHQPKTLQETAELVDRVWPSIQEANSATPSHARIEKTMIMVTKPGKAIIRAGKGTIQRAANLNQYADEIDKLYQDLEMEAGDGVDINGEKPEGLEAISEVIQRVVMSKFQLTSALSSSEDFYDLGMDSLAALGLTRSLRNATGLTSLSLSTIYANPSVSQLAQAIMDLKNNENHPQENNNEQVMTTLQEFSQALRRIATSPAKPQKGFDGHVVVLTGSTGALGTYLLSSLLANPSVSHVYCLNRAKDARSRQAGRFQKANLQLPPSDDSRLSFHQADLAQSQLGLDQKVFDEIREHATLIIHNAWPVNFNMPLDAFRPQLQGVINLFSLAASPTSFQRSVFFISSISSVLGIHTASGKTSEEIITAEDVPFVNGYAASKWITERLCEEAAKVLNISTSFARVGQVAGPVQRAGLWNPIEWFPSLVTSSIHLRAMPDSLGATMNNISWIPVDLLADTIVELTTKPQQHQGPKASTSGAKVFHLQNPHLATWADLLPTVRDSLQSQLGKPVDIVSSETWLSRIRTELEATMNTTDIAGIRTATVDGHTDDSGQNKSTLNGAGTNGADGDDVRLQEILRVLPAGKLLDYYTASMDPNAMAANLLDQSRALAESPTLRKTPAVNEAWIKKWVSEWVQDMK